MPELPEVETVKRGLEPAMVGQRIDALQLNRKNLRFPFSDRFVERIEGTTILGLSRRAKYLLAELSSGETLIMHLGMSGRFIVDSCGGTREPGDYHNEITRHLIHDHVVMRLSNGAVITYNDVRRFGFMDLAETATLHSSRHFAQMGIEPLSNAFHADGLADLFAGKTTSLKAALLDQRLIAGLGNIYVCEALHRSGLSPTRAAGTLARKTILAKKTTIASKSPSATAKAERLTREIRSVLVEAIEAGGSTLRDYVHTDGSLGYFQHRFRVYDRKGAPCPTLGCTGVIDRMVQSGRSTFYCGTCQT